MLGIGGAILFWIGFGALWWTYFGYPLFMWAWAKFLPRPLQNRPISPSVTLLIPAYNEADVIGRKLENSLQLQYPRAQLEIIVVDDGSTDGTPAIVQTFPHVTLIQQVPRAGKMNAVNLGFAQAHGEIVILSDASPNYDPLSLQLLMQPFADSSVGVVVGTLAIWDSGQGVAKQAGLYWRYEAALRRWESTSGSTVAVHGNMFAIRKALFRPLAIGTVNDEFSLAMEAMRQGYRVVDQPDAISYDEASASMQDEFNRRVRINAGRYQALFSAGYLNAPSWDLRFRLISHKLMRPLTPLWMLLMLLGNGIVLLLPASSGPTMLTLQGLWGWLCLGGQVMFYGLAGIGAQLEAHQHKKPMPISIAYFFVSTNLAALFGLWRWLTNRQQVTWTKRSVNQP